jgi:hypothetical protein
LRDIDIRGGVYFFEDKENPIPQTLLEAARCCRIQLDDHLEQKFLNSFVKSI